MRLLQSLLHALSFTALPFLLYLFSAIWGTFISIIRLDVGLSVIFRIENRVNLTYQLPPTLPAPNNCSLQRLCCLLSGKESAFNVGDPGLSSGWGRYPGEENDNPLKHTHIHMCVCIYVYIYTNMYSFCIYVLAVLLLWVKYFKKIYIYIYTHTYELI